MTYLTKSLIALILAGATLVVGATTSLAQDMESTETVVIAVSYTHLTLPTIYSV